MLLFNAHREPVKFVVAGVAGVQWERIIDTADESGFLASTSTQAGGSEVELTPRSLAVFKLTAGSQEHARTSAWKPRKPKRKPAPLLPEPPVS